MKKILSIALVLVLLAVSLGGCWQDIGAMIGGMGKDFIDGLKDGFENGATYPTLPDIDLDDFNSLLPTTTKKPSQGQTQPTITPIEIPEGSEFQVHYIDVGQADSILILCDDDAMLIDGGNDADGDTVIAYLTSVGVTELDLVVASHCHEDHLGGLDKVVSAFPVDEVWYPDYRHGSVNEEMFLEAVEKQGITPFQPDPGTTYTLGSAICQVVGPVTNEVEDPNDTSIVIKVVYGETSFLFTGDAELAEETSILDAGYDISCDVLKVGHHGAYTSTNYRWLKEAAPTYAVISVGADNSYGHPTEGTLSRLSDAEVTVYRTDLQGHIVCVSDGTNITFVVQNNPDMVPAP